MQYIHNTPGQHPQPPPGAYVQEPAVHQRSNFAQLAVALIGFAGIAIGAYFGLAAQANADASSELRLFIDKQVDINRMQAARITLVEKENATLTELNALQTIEIAQLKFSADTRRSELEVYVDLINSFPVPAWIKAPGDDNTFVMVAVNPEYTARYGLTQKQYHNKTDHEIWPKELADNFLAIDRRVARTGTAEISHVTTLIDGVETVETSIKFRVMLTNGEYGVAGFIFP